MFDWLSQHSFLRPLLDGNGKAKRLREAEEATRRAKEARGAAFLEAGMRVAQLTEHAADLVLGEDSSDGTPIDGSHDPEPDPA